MAQLLAGGIIALGVLILALTIFIATRSKKSSTIQTMATPSLTQAPQQVAAIELTATPEATRASEEPVASNASALQESTAESVAASTAAESPVAESTALATTSVESMLLTSDIDQSPLWWREQLQSLTSQLQYLREHARDVERQIAILSEIAALVTELEMLQKKRDISPEGKISIFPLHVHRQPTELSYNTDKRPAVRKYTIEALS